eukprot:scaffold201055_cov29-Tisochrysis_lutea.AAC.22
MPSTVMWAVERSMSTRIPTDEASRQRTSLNPGKEKGQDAFHFAARPAAPTPGGATPKSPACILSFRAACVVTSAPGEAHIAAAASAVTTPSSRTSSENKTGGAMGINGWSSDKTDSPADVAACAGEGSSVTAAVDEGVASATSVGAHAASVNDEAAERDTSK